MNQDELKRYARHIALPEVGIAGQEKLGASRILLIGAGGLGSPMALYLAAVGVGTIGLIDYDIVDSSNLQRQILYDESSVGKSKAEEARSRLQKLNSNITVNIHEERLSRLNAMEIFSNYDIVADGSDNFPTRYLANDACVLLGIPYIFGSILRFSGQVSVFGMSDGPCYRCLYPHPPSPESVPSCNEDGVLGVLPGVIGTLMATEAIKLVMEIGESLARRLLSYDALAMRFREFYIRKDPDCPICGEHPSIRELIDYDEFCNGRKDEVVSEDISVEEYSILRNTQEHLLLDVREMYEYQIANLGGLLIPLSELPNRLKEIPKDKNIILLCKEGVRSRRGLEILRKNGYSHLRNLAGGINAWTERIDRTLTSY
ncbi:MAG: molybdopterin-synthase adenylyltransferase MoeB [Bacteroidota bacterium]|nr:molybdopterin-synthase adenylyltransferase MoeB [Bacteroidota bacterium]